MMIDKVISRKSMFGEQVVNKEFKVTRQINAWPDFSTFKQLL